MAKRSAQQNWQGRQQDRSPIQMYRILLLPMFSSLLCLGFAPLRSVATLSSQSNPLSAQTALLDQTSLLGQKHTTVTQLPDILWDIIPPDVFAPGSIPDGELLDFIGETGELLQTVSDRRGQYAIIIASALANDNPLFLSLLSQLQDSPIGTMAIGGVELGDFAEQLSTTLTQRDQAVDAIALQTSSEQSTNSAVNFEALPDLRQQGTLEVRVETIEFERVSFDGSSTERENVATEGRGDLYAPMPTGSSPVPVELGDRVSNPSVFGGMNTRPPAMAPSPVVVISHGVGAKRHHFAELATHLASYGFVVVVPDHEPTEATEAMEATDRSEQSLTAPLTQLGETLFGALNPGEFIQRPLTISALLDELERLNASDPTWMGRFDMENVGIIGHSLGGYTGLALASGELNQKQVKHTCQDEEKLTSNLSLILQCQSEDLPRRLPSLDDQRIKAVMALNPIASAVLGKKQIGNIDVPVMIVAGSHDAIAPMMSEQLPTFSWLTTSQKYLVTIVPGGHGSVNLSIPDPSTGLSQFVNGPSHVLAAEATQALATAFMQTHLSPSSTNAGPSVQYLNSAYGQFLSDEEMTLHLVTEFLTTRE